ncbi:unnamed protein product [Durusdinium trenchii]|uniref:Glycoside hydrolase family 5 domain-containing protein n=1 Tax=Durusdinium trenchii TaxID=1381693 RepID=A0ABP0JMF5_9DINO
MTEETPLRPGPAIISGEVYKIDGKEVVLMGGNYVVKAKPYYPPLEIVRKDAKLMAEGARTMSYTPPPTADGVPRPVVPCVRLSAMMEAALPSKGNNIDASFATTLEAVVKAFKDEGVYVFLDMHQDAFGTTNGGEGYPYWVTEDFQQRAGCCCEQCCCCCCFASSCWSCCPDSCRTPYVVSPSFPLQPFFCLPSCLATRFNLDITTYPEEAADPWRPYSAMTNTGNPAWMNVGNASIRTNNSDGRWSVLVTSAQVQNAAKRMYASAHNSADRAIFFEPFVAVTKYLCSVWEKYENVVAVELINEPLFAGLPDVCYALTVWNQILSFQADVLEALDADPSVPKCPIAVANFGSTVEGESCFIKLLSCWGLPSNVKKRFDSYAKQERLILAFHYYVPPATSTFEEVIQLAKKNAQQLGGTIPIFLSEFFQGSAQAKADQLAVAVDQGVNAVTYWHYADTEFTGQGGWFIYPESVTVHGMLLDPGTGVINTPAWNAYAPTVADGTFWGGCHHWCGQRFHGRPAAGSQHEQYVEDGGVASKLHALAQTPPPQVRPPNKRPLDALSLR